MKKLSLLLLVAILLTACQSAAAPQPMTVPPTVIPPTEPPASAPTSAPVESLAASTSDLVGIWLFSQAGMKLEFKADGTYRVFSGSETIDEGNYVLDAGKVTWVTGHPTCGDQPATYEAYVTKRDGKPVSFRLQVVGSDPCSERADTAKSIAKFLSP